MAKSDGFKHGGLHSSGLTGPSSSRRALPLSVLRLSRPAPSPPCIPEIRNRSIKFLGRDPRRASREGQGTAASTRARSQARGRADRLTAPGAVGQWERAHRGCLATRWRRGGAGGDASAVDAERARRGGAGRAGARRPRAIDCPRGSRRTTSRQAAGEPPPRQPPGTRVRIPPPRLGRVRLRGGPKGQRQRGALSSASSFSLLLSSLPFRYSSSSSVSSYFSVWLSWVGG